MCAHSRDFERKQILIRIKGKKLMKFSDRLVSVTTAQQSQMFEDLERSH